MNDITVNPMFFDTVTSEAENKALEGMQYVVQVDWVNNWASTKDIAADDSFQVTNAAGVDQYSKTAAYAGDDYGSRKIEPPDPILGLKIMKLGGGVIKIRKSPVQR